jgi:SAM-dependent methyltransferase
MSEVEADKQHYQSRRWLELKGDILDPPAYSEAMHERLRGASIERVLEAGAGTGVFTERLLRLLEPRRLVGFDYDESLVADAVARFADDPRVRVIQQDLYHIADPEIKAGGFDLVAGQALLEHTATAEALPILAGLTRPGGWLYFPMNYDSPLMFEPAFDQQLDDRILANFEYVLDHQDYGGRICGDSRCGRHLWQSCRAAGLTPVEFTSADWVLWPRNGRYSGRELETLEFLIAIVADENLKPIIPADRAIDRRTIETWRQHRLAQARDHELAFICRQNSILAQRPSALSNAE